MVTHISPTSSVVSSAAPTAHRPQPRTSRRRPSQDTLRAPPTQSQPAFPPSPPLSYSSPPSSYTPRAYSESRRHGSRASSVSSRASTSAARDSRDRLRSARHSSRGARTEVTPSPQSEIQNSFPWFSQSGEVEFTLRDRSGKWKTERYLLHTLILSQNSPIFAHELRLAGLAREQDPELGLGNAVGGRTPSRRVSNDITNTQRCHYELDWSNPDATAKGGIPFLVQTDTDSSQPPPRPRNKPPTSNTSFFRSLSASLGHSRSSSTTSSSIDDDILNAYENLFLIFYNHSPRLDTRELSTAYVQCKLLLALADHYSALPVVAPRVDHHLLRFHRHLWPQIAKYPASYLKLAHHARSRSIFSEALIHVVGQWPSAAAQFSRGATDDALLDLIEDKVDDLEETKARVELKLFRLSLTTSRGERAAPASSMPDWLTVSLFRHWLAENTTPAPAGILKDASSSSSASARGASARGNAPSASVASVGRAYRALAAGGDAYLGRDELKACLKQAGGSTYSREAVRRMERRMDEMKEKARDAVKPLARSFLELDADPRHDAGDCPYLTCTRVEERDFEYVWGGA